MATGDKFIGSLNQPASELEFFQDGAIDRLILTTTMIQFSVGPSNPEALRNQGDVAYWGHVPRWPAITTTRGEFGGGNQVDVSGTAGHETFSATLNPEGGHIKLTSFGLKTLPAEILEEHAMRAGDSARERLDALAYAEAAGTSQVYKAGAVSGSRIVGGGLTGTGTLLAGATASASDFPFLEADLKVSGAMGWDHLNGRYGMVMSSIAAAQLQSEAGGTTNKPTFVTINQGTEQGQDLIRRGMVGELFNFAVFSTPFVTTGTYNSVTAYKNLAMGSYALGRSTLDNQDDSNAKFRIIQKQPSNDPYGDVNTLAWAWDGCFKRCGDERTILYATATQ